MENKKAATPTPERNRLENRDHNTASHTQSQSREHLNSFTQRAVILKHLQIHGTLTTLEARNQLFIMHPAARIQELREHGKKIITVRVDRIAKYLLSADEVAND